MFSISALIQTLLRAPAIAFSQSVFPRKALPLGSPTNCQLPAKLSPANPNTSGGNRVELLSISYTACRVGPPSPTEFAYRLRCITHPSCPSFCFLPLQRKQQIRVCSPRKFWGRKLQCGFTDHFLACIHAVCSHSLPQ